MSWSAFERSWNKAWNACREQWMGKNTNRNQFTLEHLKHNSDLRIKEYPLTHQAILYGSLEVALDSYSQLQACAKLLSSLIPNLTVPQLFAVLHNLLITQEQRKGTLELPLILRPCVFVHNLASFNSVQNAMVEAYHVPIRAAGRIQPLHPMASFGNRNLPPAAEPAIPFQTAAAVTGDYIPSSSIRSAYDASPMGNSSANFRLKNASHETSDSNRSPSPNPEPPLHSCVACHENPSDQMPFKCQHIALCRRCANLTVQTLKMCPLCREERRRGKDTWRVFIP
ncbi:hypothetical protein CspHIS471_0404110 [Cutaneotrichosporon sp. HIS471]|nr:hypothetical protein CspHIS471_0404110 [Cutaneotrichosporon sp. HIS471]